MKVEDLERYRHPDSERGRLVLRAGDSSQPRPVILLHELGGLAQVTVDFASFLVEAGCDVHLPLVFGKPGQDNAWLGTAQLCWGRQLTLLFGDRRSPFADWLASLCATIWAEREVAVTVIGMCATGGVVLSILAEDSVAAVVAAQPSLPLRPPGTGQSVSSLGASVADVEAAVDSGKPVVTTRYTKDLICPAGRLIQMDETFPGSLTTVPGRGHSTLVYDPHDDARGAVLNLLDEVYGPIS